MEQKHSWNVSFFVSLATASATVTTTTATTIISAATALAQATICHSKAIYTWHLKSSQLIYCEGVARAWRWWRRWCCWWWRCCHVKKRAVERASRSKIRNRSIKIRYEHRRKAVSSKSSFPSSFVANANEKKAVNTHTLAATSIRTHTEKNWNHKRMAWVTFKIVSNRFYETRCYLHLISIFCALVALWRSCSFHLILSLFGTFVFSLRSFCAFGLRVFFFFFTRRVDRRFYRTQNVLNVWMYALAYFSMFLNGFIFTFEWQKRVAAEYTLHTHAHAFIQYTCICSYNILSSFFIHSVFLASFST